MQKENQFKKLIIIYQNTFDKKAFHFRT